MKTIESTSTDCQKISKRPWNNKSRAGNVIGLIVAIIAIVLVVSFVVGGGVKYGCWGRSHHQQDKSLDNTSTEVK